MKYQILSGHIPNFTLYQLYTTVVLVNISLKGYRSYRRSFHSKIKTLRPFWIEDGYQNNDEKRTNAFYCFDWS